MPLFTCGASPLSRSPLRSDWTCRWWFWELGWAIHNPPDRIVSPKTTSSGGTPQTCEQVVVLLLHIVAQNNTSPSSNSQKHLKLLCMFFQLLTEVCWGMWRNKDRPCGSDHSAQKSPLLLQTELHDSWCLKLLSDPLALFHVVNEHELYSDMLTVGHLEDREKGLNGCKILLITL